MNLTSRWPLAAVCLWLGALAATVAAGRLHGQPPAPPPAPVAAQPAPAVPQELVSYRDIVKRVVPAVVSIQAKALDPKKAADRKPPQLPPGVSDDFRKFFEQKPDGPAQRRPDPDLGFGCGFVIDPAGVVMTNAHVVEGADTVVVELPDGRSFTSKDIRRDPKSDLAVVKLAADKPLPFLEFGDSDAAEVGDRVLAVGAPFGLTGSVTHGIISAKSRQNLNLNAYEDFVQTDAAINPGNSGGPLVTLDGRVVGVNSAIKTRSGGFQGVGLAISANLARDVSRQLLKDGTVRRPYLGIAVRELDDELAGRFGVKRGDGVVVSKVYDASPAGKAGLQVGDVVTSVGGAPVRDATAVPRVVLKLPIGSKVEVGYVRDGKPAVAAVAVEEQPDDFGVRAFRSLPAGPSRGVKATVIEVERAGVRAADLTPELAAEFLYPKDTRGALVAAVARGGPAADAGLVRGVVVVKVDRTRVESAQEFADAVAAASAEKGALLHVLRPTGEVDFVVLKVK